MNYLLLEDVLACWFPFAGFYLKCALRCLRRGFMFRVVSFYRPGKSVPFEVLGPWLIAFYIDRMQPRSFTNLENFARYWKDLPIQEICQALRVER